MLVIDSINDNYHLNVKKNIDEKTYVNKNYNSNRLTI